MKKRKHSPWHSFRFYRCMHQLADVTSWIIFVLVPPCVLIICSSLLVIDKVLKASFIYNNTQRVHYLTGLNLPSYMTGTLVHVSSTNLMKTILKILTNVRVMPFVLAFAATRN